MTPTAEMPARAHVSTGGATEATSEDGIMSARTLIVMAQAIRINMRIFLPAIIRSSSCSAMRLKKGSCGIAEILSGG
jgi:hypothetical protein